MMQGQKNIKMKNISTRQRVELVNINVCIQIWSALYFTVLELCLCVCVEIFQNG